MARTAQSIASPQQAQQAPVASPVASATDPPVPATPLGTLSSFRGLYRVLARLSQLPNTHWRVEISEDNGSTWTSFEAGHSGHPTPEEAISTARDRLEAWSSSRLDAESAEVAHFFKSGRLERTRVTILDDINGPVEVDGYRALDDNGKWHESTRPIEAIDRAKEKNPKAS